MIQPDEHGRFGGFGGRFAPETLMAALTELEEEFTKAWEDDDFVAEYHRLLREFAGRPTPLYRASNLSAAWGMDLWFKREDLLHTGAHKINNTIGQVLLAKRMGKARIIAETGAGQHGVATATAAAAMGMSCQVFMGDKDMERQALNVYRMRLLGTEVIPVSSGSGTLKDAVSEAMREWVATVADTHYVIGSVVGPHPFPLMVREFQKVTGDELKGQMADPDLIVACVGGGSNSMGIFYSFIGGDVELVGVEAAGLGLESGEHGASLVAGRPGVLHGARTYMLQDPEGQVLEAHSVSAGLDYPGVGPEHAYLRDAGLVRYEAVTDEEALAAFHLVSETEGIIPALESAHAAAWVDRERALLAGKTVVVNMSGRGDKDVQQVAEIDGG